MSRVGKKPVSIPKDVSVTASGNVVKIKGPKGELERSIHPNMKIQFRQGFEVQVGFTLDVKCRFARLAGDCGGT